MSNSIHIGVNAGEEMPTILHIGSRSFMDFSFDPPLPFRKPYYGDRSMETKFDKAMARIHYRSIRSPAPVTADHIRNFEREIGYPLPSDYRDFLMKFGLTAGRGDTRFTNADNPDEVESSVDVFYGLKPGDTYDLQGMRQTFSDRLPHHLLPVACGSGGEFCLALAGEDAGRIYWWFQETGRVQSPDDLEPIADSFAQFVNSLVSVEE